MSSLPWDPPFILLDLFGYIFRAWHALPPLSTRDGTPTQVVYGVAQMVLRLMNEYPSSPIAGVTEAPGKTWREEVYPEYKAHRPPPPQELLSQIPITFELISALGIPLFSLPTFEADDLIAGIARKLEREGKEVLIVTSDKDLLQLVTLRIRVLEPMKGEIFTPEKVQEKWGVPPSLLPDLLALIGDPVDGIPGVKGIGKVRAREILAGGHSLSELLEHPERIPAPFRDPIVNASETIRRSLNLITLPGPESFPELPPLPSTPPQPQWEKVKELFEKLEFYSLLRRIAGTERTKGNSSLAEKIRIATDLPEIQRYLQRDLLAFDTETTSLDITQLELVGVSLANTGEEAIYIPIRHRTGPNVDQAFLSLLKQWAEDPEKKKIGHNLKYDLNVLRRYGIELKGIAGDTMILSYLLDPDAPQGHGLDPLAERLLKYEPTRYEEVVRSGDFSDLPVETASLYSGEDVILTQRLYELLLPRLKEERLYELYERVELPLIPILASMEWWGIRVNPDKLQTLRAKVLERMERIAEEIFAMVGHPFNLQSPRQVEAVLFDELKLSEKGIRRTKTGVRTTSAEALERLRSAHPVVEKILEHRTLAKLLRTYIDSLLASISPITKRIHPQFHQAVAATGRITSQDPNLQNIPIRDPLGARLRSAFEAEPGFLFVGVDYSQLELRIMAHLSGDSALLSAFQQGEDLHRKTASELFHVPMEEVTPELRRQAKTINFGLIYGMGPQRLAEELQIPLSEAEGILERYFARYPGVRRYQEEVIRSAEERGYVTTILHRKRWIPGIRSPDRRERAQAERMAINTPIQGSAADLMKLAMIELDRLLKERSPRSRILLQVHDELLIEVPEEEVEGILPSIEACLTGVYPLSIPLTLHLGVGRTWREAHGEGS